MRVWDEDTWKVDYWDEYVAEFGVSAYIQARYIARLTATDYREEGDYLEGEYAGQGTPTD